MSERVIEIDLGVRWEPNVPEAILIADDAKVALAVRAHFDDVDRRSVVLRWSGVMWSCMGAPNDEALQHHRLYGKGLKGLHWAGQVESSSLLGALSPMVHDASGHTHYVVLLKEDLVEVIARSVECLRIAGTTREAALTSLS